MSDLKVDGIIASTGTNTNLTLQGKGSGKVAIGDGALLFPDADGSANQVIETNASGVLSFVTPASAGWNIIGTVVASDDASLTITGLDSTYDTYAIGLSDMECASNATPYLRVGDSGGVDNGASDYGYGVSGTSQAGAEESHGDTGASAIHLLSASTSTVSSAAGKGIGAMLFLHRPGDGTMQPCISGTVIPLWTSTSIYPLHVGGVRFSVITLDRVQFLWSTGNVKTGRMTVWGIAHA